MSDEDDQPRDSPREVAGIQFNAMVANVKARFVDAPRVPLNGDVMTLQYAAFEVWYGRQPPGRQLAIISELLNDDSMFLGGEDDGFKCGYFDTRGEGPPSSINQAFSYSVVAVVVAILRELPGLLWEDDLRIKLHHVLREHESASRQT